LGALGNKIQLGDYRGLMDLIDFSVVRFGKLRRLWDIWEIGEIGEVFLRLGRFGIFRIFGRFTRFRRFGKFRKLRNFRDFMSISLYLTVVPFCCPMLLSHSFVPNP